jgi:Opioid growth factor receptor (OGFr) conserved region
MKIFLKRLCKVAVTLFELFDARLIHQRQPGQWSCRLKRCADAEIMLDFFEGRLRISQGFTISDILDYSDFELETDHRYIQWLFPNRKPSRFNPNAPLLTRDAVTKMKSSALAIEAFGQSLQMMVGFYKRNDHWLCESNHNHLRISRIIEATNFILGSASAASFLERIELRITEKGFPVSLKTVSIWHDRMRQIGF